MARTDSTKTLWRVQVRKGRGYRWENKGIFETREAARKEATYHRIFFARFPGEIVNIGYGFGNTRVVRHIRGEKK